jgi:O-antigen/teichoic acid export membrane protein
VASTSSISGAGKVMTTVQRIAKNAAALYAGQGLVALLTLLLSVLLGRELGSTALGKYAFAINFTVVAAVFLDLGFDTLIVREVARDRSSSSKYIGNIVVMKVILSFVIFGLVAMTINLMDAPPDTTLAVLILGVYIVLNALGAVFMQIFQAFERMEYFALLSVSTQLIITSIGLAFIFSGHGIVAVAAACAIGGLFKFIASFLLCSKRFTKPQIEVDLNFWKSAVKNGLAGAMLPMSAVISVRTDTIILFLMKNDTVVGWYNAANILPLGLADIPSIFMSALLPLMSTSFLTSPSSLRTIYQKSSTFLLMLGLPMAAGMCLLSGRIIPLLYGSQFQPSILALRMLSWRLFLSFLSVPLSFTLISMNKQNRMAIAVATSAVTNIILNLILIPSLSYKGAAIAALVTGVVTLSFCFYWVSKHLYRLPLHRLVVKPLIACMAMGMLVYWGKAINLVLLIGLAAALYFAILYLIKAVSREDVNMIKEAIRVPQLGEWLAKKRRLVNDRHDQ